MLIAKGRRTLLLGLSVWLSLSLGSLTAARAEEPSIPSQIGVKFTRGVTNFVTGLVEFPKQIYLIGKNEGWVQGAFRGPVEGLGMFIARTSAGAYEMVTFPIPVPSNYQPMLLPEYVWQPEPSSRQAVSTDQAVPIRTPDNR